MSSVQRRRVFSVLGAVKAGLGPTSAQSTGRHDLMGLVRGHVRGLVMGLVRRLVRGIVMGLVRGL